jgi:hypothetical protein
VVLDQDGEPLVVSDDGRLWGRLLSPLDTSVAISPTVWSTNRVNLEPFMTVSEVISAFRWYFRDAEQPPSLKPPAELSSLQIKHNPATEHASSR